MQGNGCPGSSLPRSAWILLLGALPWLWFAAAQGEEYPITKAGKPVVEVVISDTATALARYAASELCDHLEQMTGFAFEPVAESAKTDAGLGHIWVGDSSVASAAGMKTEDLTPETIVIEKRGSNLILIGGDEGKHRIPPVGQTAVGTLYAVYDFLERECGIRWLWPGETGTHIPKNSSLRVDVVSRRFQPPLIQRNIRHGLRDHSDSVKNLGLLAVDSKRLNREYQLWSNRHRIGRRASFRFGHAYNHWLEKYGHEHPDWFAMMPDGNRTTPEKPYPSLERAKLCVTNPELLDFIAEEGVAYLEKTPSVLSFSACPNDSRGYCMCPKCKALDPPEGLLTDMNYPGENFQYPSLSDRYVWFWNELAKRMGDRCPGQYIGAYAYSNYNHPPLREKLSHRVIIGYVGFNYLNAEYTAQSRKDWAGWAETGCKLYLRPNLLLTGHGLPLNYARDLGKDLKECYATGMLGTDFDSMTHQYSTQAPIFYVLTALLWDPTRSVEEIYTEFMEGAYGAAAEPMRAYWDRLEALTHEIAAYKDPDADHDRDQGFHHRIPEIYDSALLAELRILLTKAKSAAGSDAAVAARILAAEVGVEYAEIQAQVLPAVKTYTGGSGDIEPLTAVLLRKKHFLQIHLRDWTIGVHHMFWREARSTRHGRLYGNHLLDDLDHPRALARLIHWQFMVDPEQEGEKKGWATVAFDDSSWDKATCLSFWEQQGHADYNGHAWYRCRITAAEQWGTHRQIVLRLGAVDESFRLYVDGALVTESLYNPAVDPDLWKKPREVDITAHMKPGQDHVIAVDVHDSGGAGGIWKPAFIIYND